MQSGGNYGWRLPVKARISFEPATNCPTSANGAPLIEPVAEYPHSLGNSITGGYVYRGSAIPALVGRYVFGDFRVGPHLCPAAGCERGVAENRGSGHRRLDQLRSRKTATVSCTS